MNKLGQVAVAAACVGIAACSGSAPVAPADASFKDGTRLKAVYQRIDGAPPFFLNWYDTHLQVDCTFVDFGLPDGRLVCFPSDPVGSDILTLFAWETTYLFTDSACTQPVFNAALAPCTARFAATGPQFGAACGAPVHLYNLGPVVPLDPAGLYNITDDGPCHPAIASELSTYKELHTLGDEIPIDSLVSGSYQHDVGAGRIVPVRIAGSDGSIQGEARTDPSGSAAGGSAAWDNDRDEMVSTSLRPGSRWFPTAQYQTGMFSDAACSVSAAIGPACRVAARECFTWAADECGYPAPTSFYELGAPVADQASVYYVNGPDNACQPYDGGAGSPIANPTLATFEIGAPVPVTAFALATEVRTGSGQIQILQAASVDGRGVFDVGFFDSVHGRPCTFQRNLQAADGVVRCLPDVTAEAPLDYYADADCSVRLSMGTTPDPCSPQRAFMAVDEDLGSPQGCYMPMTRRHIYPLGATYTGEVYLSISQSECFDLGPAGQVGNVHALGPEISAGEFAALDYVRPN